MSFVLIITDKIDKNEKKDVLEDTDQRMREYSRSPKKVEKIL